MEVRGEESKTDDVQGNVVLESSCVKEGKVILIF